MPRRHTGHEVTGEGISGGGGVHRLRLIDALPQTALAVVVHAAVATQRQQQPAAGPPPPQSVQDALLVVAARQSGPLDLIEDQQPGNLPPAKVSEYPLQPPHLSSSSFHPDRKSVV